MAKFESYESEESKFTPSVTSPDGQIKSYDLVNKKYYPQLVMESEDIPFYRIKVLSSNLEQLKYLSTKVPENYYYVYLKMRKGETCLGMIHTDKMKALLTNPLYDSLNKYILLSEDENDRVDGEMMLALCTIPNV